MRISTLLLGCLVAATTVAHSSAGYGQGELDKKITIELSDVKLPDALSEISQKARVKFFYAGNERITGSVISENATNKKLKDILSDILEPLNLGFNADGSNIYIVPGVEKKPVKKEAAPDAVAPPPVRGQVMDADGKPLYGVSVSLKGGATGTTTDEFGTFTLSAATGDSLQFSMIGMVTQTVRIDNLKALRITLKPNTGKLNEVVVVAYGKQKKINVTGAVTTVNVSDILTPNRSLSNALAGKVAGVISMQRSGEPGYDNASFTIRGIGTFTGNTSPLIIIDGVQRDDVNSSYAGSYNNIDPEDIQSISFLKDASSTAVYGAKGANGVLIITTKRGVAGKPKISLKMESSISGLTQIPKMLDGVTWMKLYNEASVNGGGQPAYSEETIEKTASGLDPYLYPNVDWIKSVYKDWAPGYNVNLNVSGGAEAVRYYVSASFYDQQGSYKVSNLNGYDPNLNFKRYDFRSNLDINLSKTTVLSMNLDAMLVSSRYPGISAGSIWYQAYSTPPIGYPIKYPGNKWAGPFNNGGSNPVNNIQNSGYSSEFRPTVQSIFALDQKLDAITPGLSAMGKFSFDSYSENDNRRSGQNDLFLATSRDPQGNLVLSQSRYGQQFLGYSQSSSAEKTMYLEANINYDRSFGQHHFSGLLLYNMRSRVVSSAGDVISSIPYRNQGLAARATYDYSDRYLLEFDAGYTGSENFEAGKRFGFFPSVSAGWVISKERFFAPVSKSVSFLKIRGSHGLVGNDQIGSAYGLTRFPYITQYGGGGSVGLGLNGTIYGGTTERVIGVQGLTWEKAMKDDIGLEIGLFNKINITVDAYKERRTDILVARSSLSGILGVSGSIFANLGEMNNHGIDGSIEYNDHIGEVSLRLYGNFTYNNNKIIEQDEPKQVYAYQQATGHKYGDQLMYVAEGLFTDQSEINKSAGQFGAVLKPGDIKYKDVNGDGVINSFDKVYTGKSDIPTILYGSGFTVGYKKFDLSLFFQGIADVSIMANGSSINGESGTASGVGVVPFTGNGSYPSGMLADIANRWTPDNPSQNVDYPRLSIANQNSNNYQPSTWWAKDGSFVRLKQATLGYTFSPSYLTNAGISGVYFYLTGQNLLTFSKFKLWDPELGSDGAGYPPVRIIAFGIKATF